MNTFSKLSDFMERLTVDFDVPGASIVVFQHGKEIFRKHVGVRNLEAAIPMDGNCLFRMFSLTKPLTATAVLQLMEQGRFLMNDPIAMYLPAYWNTRQFLPAKEGAQEPEAVPVSRHITVGDLLTMRSGLSYCGNSNPTECAVSQAVGSLIDRTGFAYTTREFADALAQAPILFEPGSHWNYSYSMDVAGALVEVWSGQTLEDYFQEHIFQPLEMTHTTFHPTEEQRSQLAVMYEYSYETRKHRSILNENEMPLYGGTVCEHGGHGLFSTLEDYSHFAKMLAGGGTYLRPDGTETRILSQKSIDLMRQNHLDQTALKDLETWSQLVGYGYGLGVRTMMHPERAGILSSPGEFGWSGLGGCYLLVDPALELTAVYMQQMIPNREQEIHPRLRNVIYSCIDSQDSET